MAMLDACCCGVSVVDNFKCMNPRQRALDILCLSDPHTKALQTRELFAASTAVAIDAQVRFEPPDTLPGRPALPAFLDGAGDGWEVETTPAPELPRGGIHRLTRRAT